MGIKGSGEDWGKARDLAERLHTEGHAEAAERVRSPSLVERMEDAALMTLREVCEFALTSIEALDPKTEMMAEEIRLKSRSACPVDAVAPRQLTLAA